MQSHDHGSIAWTLCTTGTAGYLPPRHPELIGYHHDSHWFIPPFSRKLSLTFRSSMDSFTIQRIEIKYTEGVIVHPFTAEEVYRWSRIWLCDIKRIPNGLQRSLLALAFGVGAYYCITFIHKQRSKQTQQKEHWEPC